MADAGPPTFYYMKAVNTFAKKNPKTLKQENSDFSSSYPTKIYLGEDGVGIKEYAISPFSPASLSVALNDRENIPGHL